VVLAEPGGRVAIVGEDAPDGRVLGPDDRVVAGEAGGELADLAEADSMVVAAGDQRGARRRAQRGRVELRVAQAVLGDAVERWASGSRRRKVLGTPKPESSVMISSTLGAPFGGTTVGGHQGLEVLASWVITPPKAGGAGGSWLPRIVVVALGAPRVPVTC
jgi:hypothetical protein